jgi:hypothetical protein
MASSRWQAAGARVRGRRARSVFRQQRNGRLMHPVETHLTARAGERDRDGSPDVSARRAGSLKG